jgi:glycerate kinase
MTADPGVVLASRCLRVLIAPDSFKGSFSAVEIAQAVAEGWRRARPDDRVDLAPLADGGAGTLDAIAAAGGWHWQATEVADPLRRPVSARWLLSTDGRTAVLEMAEASGLWRVAPEERDPVAATSLGTGQLIVAAAARGVERILLGIGGSATTDGGRGLVAALGARGVDEEGHEPVDLSSVSASLASVRLEVASDVSNPLLGPQGAAAIYGPQKGATPDLVRALDEALARWADRLEPAAGRRERDTPGAGAAGGVGFALLALQDRFASFALRPGVGLVMDATGFEDKLASADLVITGEGRIDESTAFGKTALGVARRAQVAGVRCVALGGGVTRDGVEALSAVGCVVVPVIEAPMSVEAAIALGLEPVTAAGERIAGILSMGLALGATAGVP